jgi:hypothetical protein
MRLNFPGNSANPDPENHDKRSPGQAPVEERWRLAQESIRDFDAALGLIRQTFDTPKARAETGLMLMQDSVFSSDAPLGAELAKFIRANVNEVEDPAEQVKLLSTACRVFAQNGLLQEAGAGIATLQKYAAQHPESQALAQCILQCGVETAAAAGEFTAAEILAERLDVLRLQTNELDHDDPFNTALPNHPRPELHRLAIAQAYLARGKELEALEVGENITTAYERSWVLYDVASALFQKGALESSKAEILDIVEATEPLLEHCKDEFTAEIYGMHWATLLLVGRPPDLDQVEQQFEDPLDQSLALQCIAKAYAVLGDREQVQKVGTLVDDANHAQAVAQIGAIVALLRGDLEYATARSRQICRQYNSSDLLEGFAQELVEANQPALAAEVLRAALKHALQEEDSEHVAADAHLCIGWKLYALNQAPAPTLDESRPKPTGLWDSAETSLARYECQARVERALRILNQLPPFSEEEARTLDTQQPLDTEGFIASSGSLAEIRVRFPKLFA